MPEHRDLDEAKRVLAAMRLELGDPHGRGHNDTTTHLSDAEIAERFALDDEGDPVWRERPLKGDEATIRERARWNSRHAGKKLDDRAKFEFGKDDPRKPRQMWRKDIIARLVAIRDRGATPVTPAVSSDCTQGYRIPQDGDQGRAALAKVRAIEGATEREARAKPLEGLIIPPTLIRQGPPARVLMKAKLRTWPEPARPSTCWSGTKDPFAQDTPM